MEFNSTAGEAVGGQPSCVETSGEQITYLQLTLVRHGETQANKEKVIQGQRDTPLSDHGRRQGKLVGQRLAVSETISHIYSSDLVRATETAELIRAQLPCPVDVTMDTRLRERAFGSLEGRPVSELVEAARRAEVKVREYTPVEGESLEEVNRRLSEFQKSMLSDVSKLEQCEPIPRKEGSLLASSPSPLPPPQWHVLLVGHGGALHSLCEQLREMSGCELPRRNASTPNAAITSFLLTLHGQCCHSVTTLTAHNTQHLSCLHS